MIGRRIGAVLLMVGVLAASTGGCAAHQNSQGEGQNMEPDRSADLTDAQQVALIDGMRAKGSYEAARERLTTTARLIADRISAAVPGQTWKFDDNPHGRRSAQDGLTCDELTARIARRPVVDTVVFGAAFSAEGFITAASIVREQAAKYGATGDDSLFNEPEKRDYTVRGNGYEFNIGQITFATLNIHGDCFLLQHTLDLPVGQLPPQPPIVPTAPTP